MSSQTRVALQPAFVLHQRPFRNTSALVDVFTQDYGRLALVARGVRTAKSRTQGLLQSFRPLLLSWFGTGDLVTLSGVESHGQPQQLAGRIALSGFYLNELLLRLLHRHDPHAALFQVYAATLQALEDPAQEQRALRIFEKQLLQELGYALVLDRQADTGEPLAPDRLYSYHPENGLLPVDEQRPAGIALHGSSLLSLARNELQDAVSLREAKQLMRASLALYLGDKPLQSRKLLNELHRNQAAPQ